MFGCFRPQAVICNLSIYLSYYNCCKNVSLRCCYKVLQYHHACGNTFFVMIFVSAICNMFYNIIHLLLLDKALKSEINSEILLNFYFPFAAFFLCLRLSQANHNILWHILVFYSCCKGVKTLARCHKIHERLYTVWSLFYFRVPLFPASVCELYYM